MKKYRLMNRLKNGFEMIKVVDNIEDANHAVLSGQVDYYEEITNG